MQDLVVRLLDREEAFAHAKRLQEIFRDAVAAAGPQHYTADQVHTWASTADDVERWRPWLADGEVWVAYEAGSLRHPIGLMGLWPTDHVHLLYVDPLFQRRRVATALLAKLADIAARAGIAAFTTDASLVAHPVFAACGFEVVAWEEVERKGQAFRRARMRKVCT